MACASLMLWWIPLRHIREDHRLAQWPVVQARITEGRLEFRHQPAQGKHPSWDGWCAKWNYAYEWRGVPHSGLVDDDTASVFAPGCFAYETRAWRALERRPPGSTLAVRVDPEEPWHSSTQPIGLRVEDFFFLAIGLLPIGSVTWLIATVVRDRRALRSTPSDRPPATP